MVVIEPQLNKHLIRKLRTNTLHILGYDVSADLDPVVERTVDEALEVAVEVVRLKGIFHVLPVLRAGKTGVETQVGVINSAMFARLVNKCSGNRSIVFMLATIGEELERIGRANELLFHQLIYDTIGSELIEMMADLLEVHWRGRLENTDLQLSSRFSPGYCDWPLAGQEVIFASVDADLIGVRLTSYSVMEPNKSISAVAVAAEKVPTPAPCVFCAKKDCQWRRFSRHGESYRHSDVKIASIG